MGKVKGCEGWKGDANITSGVEVKQRDCGNGL